MNISSINFSNSAIWSSSNLKKVSPNTSATKPNFSPVLKTLNADTVSFSGGAVGGYGTVLKKLVPYKVPDMYTGLMMLEQRDLERLQKAGVFRQPLAKMVKTVSHYEDTMLPINKEFFGLLKGIAAKKPHIKLEDAMSILYHKHEKKLLKEQKPIFGKIFEYACDMPKDLYKEFLDLMNITYRRLDNDPVILPFSEKEFKYKLGRIAKSIRSENKFYQVRAINKLERAARKVFLGEPKGVNPFGRNKMTIQKKLEHQMQPENLKHNTDSLNELRRIFENSCLRNNKDLVNLFETTSAKICGFPTFVQFERKAFIHDLRKIAERLDDKKLEQKIMSTARSLPTSRQDLSAFIVKYAHEPADRIGYGLLRDGVGSIDHLLAKNNGGKNLATNYGLCGAGINSDKTDIFFDEWVRKHPETADNCQKYVDRLIELEKAGIFDKVSRGRKKQIDKHYIEDFAQTIYDISPAENRIKLDISKLYTK